MKLRTTLLHLAALASASVSINACSAGSTTAGPGSDGGTEDASADASAEAAPACGGCNCGAPAVTQGNATPDEACAILASTQVAGSACNAFCAGLNGGKTATYFCSLPGAYSTAYQAAQADADAGSDADAGKTCPAWTDQVVVQCGYPCLGRRTSGIDDPTPCETEALGAVFANRAYLEAVSVHAFARLERELAFHGAPPALRRDARRARRDEVRHTAMTVRLARRFGETASLPAPAVDASVRGLFEIACENAVEGCVRETYGAVMGLVEAATSSDSDVRRSSQRIAEDECRHAELAMDVARWLAPQLTPAEREAVDAAVDEAIADLRARGDRRIVDLLDARVWKMTGPSHHAATDASA
jgi:hypothetical protein